MWKLNDVVLEIYSDLQFQLSGEGLNYDPLEGNVSYLT